MQRLPIMLNYKYLISWSTALDFGTMFEFKIEKAGCYRESWLLQRKLVAQPI